MELNFTKTELLRHPSSESQTVKFSDGTSVPLKDTVKYLGSSVTWFKPAKEAIQARLLLASSAYSKLQHMWRSRAANKLKVFILHDMYCPNHYVRPCPNHSGETPLPYNRWLVFQVPSKSCRNQGIVLLPYF